MDLPRDEMAFRKHYETLVLEQQLTTVFRPGNRLFPNYRGYKHHEIITARIIDKPGCDVQEIAPVFTEVKIPVKITDIRAVDIATLGPDDFCGSSPDVQNLKELLDHLEEIYKQPISAFQNEVTRIQFLYLNETVQSQMRAGSISA